MPSHTGHRSTGLGDHRAFLEARAWMGRGKRALLFGWLETHRRVAVPLAVPVVARAAGPPPSSERPQTMHGATVAVLAGLIALTPGAAGGSAVRENTEADGSVMAGNALLFVPTSAVISGSGGALGSRTYSQAPFDAAFDPTGVLYASALTGAPDASGRQVQRYRAVPGDTLWEISQRSGVSVMTLWWANRFEDAQTLDVGQLVRVLPASGIEHVVRDGDTIDSIARDYGADAADIAAQNGLVDGIVLLGQRLVIPDGRGDTYRPIPGVSRSTSIPRLRPGQADRAAEARTGIVTAVLLPVPDVQPPTSTPETAPDPSPGASPDPTPDQSPEGTPETPSAMSPEALGVKRTAGIDSPSLGSEPARSRVTPTVTGGGGRLGLVGFAPWWRKLYSRVVAYLYEPTGANDGPDVPSDGSPVPSPDGNGGVVIAIPPDAPVPHGPGVHRTYPDGPPPAGPSQGRALEVDDPRLTLTARQAREEGLMWPVYRGGTVTQLFHDEHYAIDIAAPKGTPLLAPWSGIMVFRHYRDDRCANAVWIKHGPRFYTSYCHLWRFSDVRRGDWVEKGEVIGYVGNGGYSTGPHVHFGVSVGPSASLYAYRRDPLQYLRPR